MAKKKQTSKLRISLTKSSIGRLQKHKACLVGLGLKRIGQVVEREDTPCVRGMINKISYMLQVEEC